MEAKWFRRTSLYDVELGISLCVLVGGAFRRKGVAVTLGGRARPSHGRGEELLGGEAGSALRKPEIMADAAHYIWRSRS